MKLRTLLAAAPARAIAASAAPTFANVCSEWLRHGERERQLKQSTLIDYRAAISSRLEPTLGGLPIDELSTGALQTWRDELLTQGAISYRTINKLTTIVGAVLEYARRQGLIADNPARRLEKLKERAYDDLEF